MTMQVIAACLKLIPNCADICYDWYDGGERAVHFFESTLMHG